MNRIMAVLLTLTGISHATEPPARELVIQHVPENIEIVKTCGASTQQQTTQLTTNNNQGGGYHYSSIMSIHSMLLVEGDKASQATKTSECTLTIRTPQPCVVRNCRQTINFYAKP